MTLRSFVVLLVVTLAAAAAAVWVTMSRDIAGVARGEGVLAFPGLADRVNDVRRIVVTRGQFTSTLESREAEGGLAWSLKERAGYPAPIEIVRAVAAGMAQLRLVEPKTARPDLYPRIHVDDPTGPNGKDARGALVELFDARGQKMAELIVGLDKGTFLGLGDVYVRRPDEERAWLAHGKVPVPDQQVGWLNQVALEVDLPRIRETVLRVPGEKPLRIFKNSEDERDFTVEGMPETHELVEIFGAEDIARAIQTLAFEEVAPMSELGLAYEGDPRRRHVTFDGLIVEEWAAERDGAVWVAIRARPDPEPKDSAKVDGEKVAAEVARINGVAAGWAYMLNEFESKNIRQTMATLTQPKEAAKDGKDAGTPSN